MKFVSVRQALSACLWAAGLVVSSAWAQSAAPANVAPIGSGPGVHSPNSPFAPLPVRGDVLPWSVLTETTTKTVKNRVLPVFSASVKVMHNTTQRLQGFMTPLNPGERQTHFLLSSVPLTCSFCLPGGPESMVEVKTKTPVKYSLEPVVVQGKFNVLADDPYGLFYRITDAISVN